MSKVMFNVKVTFLCSVFTVSSLLIPPYLSFSLFPLLFSSFSIKFNRGRCSSALSTSSLLNNVALVSANFTTVGEPAASERNFN